MIERVTFQDFRDRFRTYDRKDQFSYEGSKALFEYLESLEEEIDEAIELDVIALCCDYSEDEIALVLKEHNLESLEDLESETQIIWHNDTHVLYENY